MPPMFFLFGGDNWWFNGIMLMGLVLWLLYLVAQIWQWWRDR